MSLVAAMLRMTAVRALRGNTAAGVAILDSSIEALSDIMTDAQQPAILVRIDQVEEPGKNEGLFARSAIVTLSFDLLVASKVTYEKPNGNGPVTEIVIESTDAGLEFSLDMLDRQLRRALSDPTNAFAEAFRKLVASFGPVKSSRGIDPETGRKHAIRMIEIDVEPICDPAPGEEIGEAIDAVLTLLATVADYVPAVEIMRAELAKGASLTSWQKLQSAMMTAANVPGLLGVAPPDAVSPEGEAAEAVELQLVTPFINGHEGAAAGDILPNAGDDDQGAEL